MNEKEVITLESDPNHFVVGKHWAGYSYGYSTTMIYHCYKWDRSGYHLTNIHDPEDQKCISERAINRTFWKAERSEKTPSWWVSQWSSRFFDKELALKVAKESNDEISCPNSNPEKPNNET